MNIKHIILIGGGSSVFSLAHGQVTGPTYSSLPWEDPLSGIVGEMVRVTMALGIIAGLAILIVWLLLSIYGGDQYETDVKKTQLDKKKIIKEKSLLDEISGMVDSDMNVQVVNVVDKCKKVHAGYQKYPKFSYRRTEFYKSDLALIHDFLTAYRNTETLKKSDMDHMTDTMQRYERGFDDILNMQHESILNKFRVALDVMKAKSH